MDFNQSLSKFEQLVETLVESTFGNWVGDQIQPQVIATKLSRALETSSYSSSGFIANTFDVYLHPEDLVYILSTYPDVDSRLSEYLIQLAKRANLPLTDLPLVIFAEDPLLRRMQVRVLATYDPTRDSTQTRQHKRQVLDEKVRESIKAVDAFLVINGERHVSLDSPSIMIGRRIDNDVVIDSPSVSRKHAQLRWRYSHYIIYDVGSRYGIKVNGQVVRECVLQNGDVIELSSIRILYNEGGTRSIEDEVAEPRIESTPTQKIPKSISDHLLDEEDTDPPTIITEETSKVN